jgi:hypothetical protein
MFQFPGYAPLARYHAFSMVGCPIRTPADHRLFASPRSFSQLITSFVASESLGILHTLFSYFFFQVMWLLLHLTRLCARFTREVLIPQPDCSSIGFRPLLLLFYLQHVNELFARYFSLNPLQERLFLTQGLKHPAT